MNKLNILIKNGDLLDKNKLCLYLKLLKLKEKETYKHSIRVSKYATKLAKKMELSEDEIAVIWIAGLLHDLGKLLIPNDLLLGNKPLSIENSELIKKHPIDGVNYLKDFTSERVYLGALEHHERLDGKGYPYGLKKISLIGRIIAIVDTFDAMTSNRTYQASITFEEAIIKMEDLVNENFYDKKIFKYFKEVIHEINIQ